MNNRKDHWQMIREGRCTAQRSDGQNDEGKTGAAGVLPGDGKEDGQRP